MESNSLRWDHLTDKKDIIRAWIYTVDQFYLWDTKEVIKEMSEPWQNVNYYWTEVSWKTNNILNWWEKSYYISDCNSLPKHSSGYADCTWVAIVGTDAENWEQISIMTHQDPKFFFSWDTRNNFFKNDLSKRISLIKDMSVNWSIDAVIFGWYFRYDHFDYAYKKYIFSLKLLNEVISKVLWFSPVVITWPNFHLHNWAADVYLDTANRRLHIIRPTQKRHETNQSFMLDWISRFDYYMWEKNLDNITDPDWD